MAYGKKSPLHIIEGGTNTQSFTNVFGVTYYDGTILNNVDPGLANYVLTSNGSSAPSFKPIPSPFFVWHPQTTTPVTLTVNEGYVMQDGSNLITATLPATAAFGDVIVIEGASLGLWTIAQNAGQTIHMVGTSTTPGVTGSVTSTSAYDSIELLCTTANTDFKVRSSMGNLIFV